MRRAIGWIAAYVLALQTILGSVAPRLAPAVDPALPFDLAAICLSSHGGGGLAGDIPGGSGSGSQVGDHCVMCTSSPPPVLAAPHGIRVVIHLVASEPVAPAPPVPPRSKVPSRPGGARAPPMMA
jgi:hypothetical protein